jgi:hypothetical protein
MDTEHVFNARTGRVEPHRANRVVQALDDGTERTLSVRESIGNVQHPETGEVIGTVPIREMFDEDGNKVRFEGPRGEVDPSVTVTKN